MPYARTLGALGAMSALAWIAAVILLIVLGPAPNAWLDFAIGLAVALTIVAAQIWMCSFAAAGRANLTENLVERVSDSLKAEAERLQWVAFADLAETVLTPRDDDPR